MTIRAREFDTVVEKFGFETRETHHVLAWLKVDGKLILRTKRSRGSGELAALDLILQQMRLSADQFRDAASCSFSREDYLEHLRGKGLLE